MQPLSLEPEFYVVFYYFFPHKFFFPREEDSLISATALRYFEILYSHWLSHNLSSNTNLFLKTNIHKY